MTWDYGPSTHAAGPQFAYDHQDMNTASLLLGMSVGFAVFAGAETAHQSWQIRQQTGRVNAYIVMAWGEIVLTLTLAFVNWFHLWGSIKPSFGLWFAYVAIWCFQIQFLMQILVNRVSSLMCRDRREVRRNALLVFAAILALNASVFVCWIPARLGVSARWVAANAVWDRIEKALFLCVDAALNGVFIYLVAANLVRMGLRRYLALFRYNLCMVCLSVSLDAAAIGLMSLPTDTLYVQFQCVSYLAKLQIELNMASLIRKIAEAILRAGPGGQGQSQGQGQGAVRCAGDAGVECYGPHPPAAAATVAGVKGATSKLPRGSPPLPSFYVYGALGALQDNRSMLWKITEGANRHGDYSRTAFVSAGHTQDDGDGSIDDGAAAGGVLAAADNDVIFSGGGGSNDSGGICPAYDLEQGVVSAVAVAGAGGGLFPPGPAPSKGRGGHKKAKKSVRSSRPGSSSSSTTRCRDSSSAAAAAAPQDGILKTTTMVVESHPRPSVVAAPAHHQQQQQQSPSRRLFGSLYSDGGSSSMSLGGDLGDLPLSGLSSAVGGDGGSGHHHHHHYARGPGGLSSLSSTELDRRRDAEQDGQDETASFDEKKGIGGVDGGQAVDGDDDDDDDDSEKEEVGEKVRAERERLFQGSRDSLPGDSGD